MRLRYLAFARYCLSGLSLPTRLLRLDFPGKEKSINMLFLHFVFALCRYSVFVFELKLLKGLSNKSPNAWPFVL